MCYNPSNHRGYIHSKGLVGWKGSPKTGKIDYIAMEIQEWQGWHGMIKWHGANGREKKDNM